MNRVEELIQQLCPKGLEWKKLGEVCEFCRGTVITQKEAIKGNVPVISGGQTPAYFHNKANRPGNTIVVAGSGAYAGFVSFWEIPIFVSDAFTIKPHNELNVKFVFYFLKTIQHKIYATKKGAGIPHVHGSSIQNFEIPIPPLPIQQEIVRILDTFTNLQNKLSTNLQTELEARKKQYAYYRDCLLNFEGVKGVEWKKVKDFAEIGTGNSNTQDELLNGLYPFFVRSQIIRWKNEYEFDETAIITSGDGVGVGRIFHYIEGKYALHQRAYRIHVLDKEIFPKYIFYYMRHNFYNYITKNAYSSSVTSIRKPMLLDFPVPIPPLSEQRRIVSILDQFETLVNDLSIGLPAELEARRKQYEYYRDKLLTFDRV